MSDHDEGCDYRHGDEPCNNRIGDLEAALAECEREKGELKRANEALEPVWCKSKEVVADLERKLAAAREAGYKAGVDDAIGEVVMWGMKTQDERRKRPLVEHIRAALTEAGEQEKK